MQRSSNKALHTVTASLPLVFPVLVAATAQEADGIFCEFGSEPQLVRRVSAKEVDNELARMKQEKGAGRVLTQKQWRHLLGINLLKRAAAKKDVLALEEALPYLLDFSWVDPDGKWETPTPKEVLAAMMTSPVAILKGLTSSFFGRAIHGTRLVYWIHGPGASRAEDLTFWPGLYCPDLKTAFVVNSILRDAFRICPRCKKTFRAKHDELCCSLKCREAHRVARWRRKQKGA